MTEWLYLAESIAAGGFLGALFFAGLWWTIRRSLDSAWPAVWFAGSALVRILGVVAGLYLVAGSDPLRWAGGIAGFALAQRAAVMHARRERAVVRDGGTHAPES
ncbi:MAG: ATP synthase subunit I [Betaproteobacteria bacterium]|nr:ATP synthase subunit I [Betaproteobacteria bacterium]